VLGAAIKGRRDKVLISTKATFRFAGGPNDVGSSRFHLVRSCEAQLKRLGADYIDLYQMHGFDAADAGGGDARGARRPREDREGEVRRVFELQRVAPDEVAGVSDRYGWARYVAHQAYYSLVGRDYECELMPLGLDQGVGCVVWSPLGWGRLTGKVRRGQPLPKTSRLNSQLSNEKGPPLADEYVYKVVDALDGVAKEAGKTVPQVALNWLLQRPTVSSVIIGARDEGQLTDNLGAVGWALSPDQVSRLDAASAVTLPYPYWHQRGFFERNPPPVA
jgi:aryl-alcohol dehydrogenase-like predicted oxidoreductase